MKTLPDWPTTSLGQVLVFIGNGTTAEQNKEGKGLPVTRIETIADEQFDLNRVGYVENPGIDLIERYRIESGDILFSHINSEPQIGRAVIYKNVPPILLHGMNLLRLRFNPDAADPDFMVYLFRHYRERGVFISLASRAVGQSSINQGRLKNLQIQLPTLPEQRAIADVLHTLQRAKDARRHELALERERKAALVEYLVTRGTRGEKRKPSEIGKIPDSWCISEASDICTKVTDGTHDTPKRTTDGEFLVTAVHIKAGRVEMSEAYRISRKDFDQINERSKVDRFDVLMTMIGAYTGEVAFVADEPMYAIKNVGLFKTGGNKELGQWLSYFFQSQTFQEFLKVRVSGTSQPYAPLWLLRSLPIPVPSDTERDEIVSALSSIDLKISALEKEIRLVTELFAVLQEDLMLGRQSATNLTKGTINP